MINFLNIDLEKNQRIDLIKNEQDFKLQIPQAEINNKLNQEIITSEFKMDFISKVDEDGWLVIEN